MKLKIIAIMMLMFSALGALVSGAPQQVFLIMLNPAPMDGTIPGYGIRKLIATTAPLPVGLITGDRLAIIIIPARAIVVI